MKITILDDYTQEVRNLSCFSQLNGYPVNVLNGRESRDEYTQILAETEILVLIRERTCVDSDFLKKTPRLRLISQTGKISNHLNLADCTAAGVAVAEGMGSPIAPAELSWALLMNTLRRIPQSMESMKKGQWQSEIGETVYGKKLGIWGYGKIGQRMAQYAQAFGAQVWVWGSEKSRQLAIADGYWAASSKEAFFQESDIISLHLRLSPATYGIVKESDLMKMKPSAALINTARAELIETGALLRCIQNGRPGLVGLDVYENEPDWKGENPYLKYPNVLCTPHLGYFERNGYELYFEKAFENVVQFIEGKPRQIANPEVFNPL